MSLKEVRYRFLLNLNDERWVEGALDTPFRNGILRQSICLLIKGFDDFELAE